MPADETHIHYDAGQTETDLSLTPGPHTLRLQFADGAHRSYGPAMSTQISITVEEASAEADGEAGEAAEGETAESDDAEAANEPNPDEPNPDEPNPDEP